jgi:undecaprenyl-diphosphatase
MELWQAVLLGLVEGFTEYLPVSSTGHLLLVQRLLGIPEGRSVNAFLICIQAGAVAAVLTLYFGRVRQLARGLAGRDPVGRRLSIDVALAFLPAAIVGLAFDDWIDEHLFRLWPIIGAWFVGGVAILVVAYKRRGLLPPGGFDLEHLRWHAALAIGVAQCAAMWPGTSRSLATIVAGVLVGMNLVAAVEFSFLLGLVTLFAATAYKATTDGIGMVDEFGYTALAAGFLAALLSAWASVRWMVDYLQRRGLELFGYWRVALALVAAALLGTGWIAP